ncbi:hypothetical protein NDU88_002003 [Pleurodeles waltl]|uniref:Uncharacterized protein n=1 Tax=Pleurodeles waltl TaxID=8319 RepID=A0AAV7M2R6_PLEWA|nr:hypothetical protein NDU88_002003 [Pleurodeles waltl]
MTRASAEKEDEEPKEDRERGDTGLPQREPGAYGDTGNRSPGWHTDRHVPRGAWLRQAVHTTDLSPERRRQRLAPGGTPESKNREALKNNCWDLDIINSITKESFRNI